MADSTPMMRQYLEIKKQNPDSILFFRLGDFYEMFNEDAKLVSKELDLTLTTRDRGKDKEEQTPMCGVPYHASEGYIARLVSRGYKVAICEQMEDPATAKGIVKRDITRIVTPGTVTESSMLDESRNNYYACALGENSMYGLCFCDISTGCFYATEVETLDQVYSELGRFAPSEALCGGDALQTLPEFLKEKLDCLCENGAAEYFNEETAKKSVVMQFEKTLEQLGLVGHTLACRCVGGLLRYLRETCKIHLFHLRDLEFYIAGSFLALDLAARRNLELTETLRGGEKKGSLLWVLDKTKTAMGSRMLRSWLEKPLLSPKRINRRLDAVGQISNATILRQEILELLSGVSDFERVLARIVTGTANARDLLTMESGCRPLTELRAATGRFRSPLLALVQEEMDDLRDLRELIAAAIKEDAPVTVREGGMICDGYNEELDTLRDILNGGKGILARIEAEEKEKTGIKNLRVGFNRVFGYYIEVAKGQVSLVPDTYIRKQTLANGERYITEELKILEEKLLTAKERAVALEFELFTALREHLAAQAERIQRTARAVACVDVLSNFAELAIKYNYCRPEVDLSDEISICEGRHPVVERMLKDSLFVPNDTLLNTAHDRCAIITGPNMAGKSTYMRQVALTVLMAQIGCFVPARKAHVGVVDRIFTRIGASDDLSAGKSTFMVEMSELADILRLATPRSLLILDEIGRGTSTFDGMAIARAVLEHAADKKRLGAKTLFATHYHELTNIENEISGVRNYNIAVKKRGSDIVFLRRIVSGAADRSYGVEVAKLAGLPERVVARARELLRELESGAPVKTVTVAADDQISITSMENDALRQKLERISIETLTPIEAMNVLFELKNML